MLVERPLYNALLDRLASVFESLRVGPSELDLECGPLISRKQQQRVWDFVSDAQHAGISVMAQGQIVAEAPESGYYQVPMLFRDVPPAHRLAQEEVFGPLLAAMPFDSEAEAVALANGTPYGLVAGLWTRDGGRQLRLARKLRAGQVSSTTMGPAAAWSCRSAAPASPATAARRASRPCTALPPSKPLPFNMGNINFLSVAFAIFFSGWLACEEQTRHQSFRHAAPAGVQAQVGRYHGRRVHWCLYVALPFLLALMMVANALRGRGPFSH